MRSCSEGSRSSGCFTQGKPQGRQQHRFQVPNKVKPEESLTMKAKLIAVLFALTTLTSIAQGQSQDLYLAARSNNIQLAQALIDQKVDINQKDERGYTALILATYNQSPDV